jgi:hypothetical protein
VALLPFPGHRCLVHPATVAPKSEYNMEKKDGQQATYPQGTDGSSYLAMALAHPFNHATPTQGQRYKRQQPWQWATATAARPEELTRFSPVGSHAQSIVLTNQYLMG